jgi:hypothetical protein
MSEDVPELSVKCFMNSYIAAKWKAVDIFRLHQLYPPPK